MKLSRLCRNLMLALLFVPVPLVASAGDSGEEKGFAVRVDLDNMRDSKIGEKLLGAIRALAAEELDAERDPEKAFANIEKALGFDPFEELHSVTVLGRDFTDPLEGIQVTVGMGTSTGNLEGLLLALPGYESEEHDDHIIHSVQVENDMRIHGAIHGKSSQAKNVVIATSRDGVSSMLQSLSKGGASPSDVLGIKGKKNALINVRLNEIPDMDDLEGPPKTIARLIKEVSLSIAAEGNELDVTLQLKTDSEKHAEQLQQLAQGLVAMVSLAQESEDDEELAMIAGLVEDLEAERDGKEVELHLQVPESIVLDFMREELDLPLDR